MWYFWWCYHFCNIFWITSTCDWLDIFRNDRAGKVACDLQNETKYYVSNTVHFLNQQKKIIPQKLTPNIYACVHKITFFVVNEFFFDVVQRRKKMFHMVTGGGHKCLSQSAV